MDGKRLYRSRLNYILSGLCGGLGEYFGINATIIRVVFLMLGVWGGSGLLLYIILSIVIPKEPENITATKSENSLTNTTKRNFLHQGSERRNLLGVVLVLFGLLELWNKFVPVQLHWEYYWPILIIFIGIYIIFR